MIGLQYDDSHSSYGKNNAGSVREHYYVLGIIKSLDLDFAGLKGKIESTDM